jgi:hypothetical protein
VIHRERIEGIAADSGFRKDSVEKVVRLCRILRRLDSHPTTEGQWLLKGGTALNLLHLDVPRMSVDIDLNYIGEGGRDAMAAARPGFEAALVSVCEREGCSVRRTPGEHAGGKFRLRFVSVFGGSQNLEIDVSYVARVPLLGFERLATRFPPDEPVEVATLSFKELAAGKFCALMQRSVPRDAFDAANLLGLMPGLLEDAEFRLAFVCAMAGGRQDPGMLSPRDPAPTVLDVRQQLLPMLRLVPSAAQDAESLQRALCAQLARDQMCRFLDKDQCGGAQFKLGINIVPIPGLQDRIGTVVCNARRMEALDRVHSLSSVQESGDPGQYDGGADPDAFAQPDPVLRGDHRDRGSPGCRLESRPEHHLPTVGQEVRCRPRERQVRPAQRGAG